MTPATIAKTTTIRQRTRVGIKPGNVVYAAAQQIAAIFDTKDVANVGIDSYGCTSYTFTLAALLP